MLKEILRCKYSSNQYDEDKKLLKQTWFNKIGAMTTEEFKEDMLAYADLYSIYGIRHVLVDTTGLNFTIEIELQEWIDKNIFSIIALHLNKLAFLMSKDIFEQISIEQAMDANGKAPIDVRYFEHEDEAFRWFFE